MAKEAIIINRRFGTELAEKVRGAVYDTYKPLIDDKIKKVSDEFRAAVISAMFSPELAKELSDASPGLCMGAKELSFNGFSESPEKTFSSPCGGHANHWRDGAVRDSNKKMMKVIGENYHTEMTFALIPDGHHFRMPADIRTEGCYVKPFSRDGWSTGYPTAHTCVNEKAAILLDFNAPGMDRVKELYEEWREGIYSAMTIQGEAVRGVNAIMEGHKTVTSALKVCPSLWDLLPESTQKLAADTPAARQASKVATQKDITAVNSAVVIERMLKNREKK